MSLEHKPPLLYNECDQMLEQVLQRHHRISYLIDTQNLSLNLQNIFLCNLAKVTIPGWGELDQKTSSLNHYVSYARCSHAIFQNTD